MARKRRALHRRFKHGKKRRNPDDSPASSRRAPMPLFAEITEFVLPGFAGFAATRLLTRMAVVQITKRKPEWAKHAGALASAGSFLAAWYGANRVKLLEKHHLPIVVGSAIAAIQSIIQMYIPSLGWTIGDPTPELASGTDTSLLAAPSPMARLQVVNEDPNAYTYDDKFDAGLYAKQTSSAGPTTRAQKEEDLLADLQLDDDNGVFNAAT